MHDFQPASGARRSGVRASLRRFLARDERGAVAIEFGLVASVFIAMLLAITQFALLFLSQVRLHDVLADVAAGPAIAIQADRGALTDLICEQVILADECATGLRLEKAPLSNYATTLQPITGTNFAAGKPNDLMLIRAEVPIMTFVPGLPPLFIRGATLFVRT